MKGTMCFRRRARRVENNSNDAMLPGFESSSQFNFEDRNVASELGSGINSRDFESRNWGNLANSARRPSLTAFASPGSKSQKYKKGVRAPNSSPMNNSSGKGASNNMA